MKTSTTFETLMQSLRLLNLADKPTEGKPPAVSNGADFEPFRICSDGERTTHLTKLAGHLISRGFNKAETLRYALSWNKNNTPPLQESKVTDTVEGIFRTHLKNHQKPPEDSEPLFDVQTSTIARFIANEPPQRKWVLDDILPLGIVGSIVAPGGSGKSQFSIQLALTVACGKGAFKFWQSTNPGSVVMICAEDEEEELHRRIYNVFTQLYFADISAVNAITSRVHVISRVGLNNLMTESQFGIKETSYVDRLLLAVAPISDLRLIIIDPASRFRGGDENSAEDVTRFIEQAEKIARITKATVLILHHVNKMSGMQSDQSQTHARGSSAFSDGIRWQLNLSKPNRDQERRLNIPNIEKETINRFLVATVTKNNYGPPIENLYMRRSEGGLLISAYAAGIGKVITKEDMIFNTIAKSMYEKTPLTINKFVKANSGMDKPIGLGDNSLRTMLNDLVDQGKLVKLDGKTLALPQEEYEKHLPDLEALAKKLESKD